MCTTWPIVPDTPASLPFIVTSTAPALPIVTSMSAVTLKDSVAPLYKVPCHRTVPLESVTENQLFAFTALNETVEAGTTDALTLGVAAGEAEAATEGVAVAAGVALATGAADVDAGLGVVTA